MKIPITEVPEKHPKLILMFEKEWNMHAIWHNKITGHFKYWLRQKIKFKNLKCKDPNCPKFGQKFPSKHSLANHITWHDPDYRKSLSGENAGMYGRRGEEHPSYKYDDIGYLMIHLRAHEADPPPKDGICAYCHKVKDKYGKSKLEHSNKDHSYRLPINPDEWWWIHHNCHIKYDIKHGLMKNPIGRKPLFF